LLTFDFKLAFLGQKKTGNFLRCDGGRQSHSFFYGCCSFLARRISSGGDRVDASLGTPLIWLFLIFHVFCWDFLPAGIKTNGCGARCWQLPFLSLLNLFYRYQGRHSGFLGGLFVFCVLTALFPKIKNTADGCFRHCCFGVGCGFCF